MYAWIDLKGKKLKSAITFLKNKTNILYAVLFYNGLNISCLCRITASERIFVIEVSLQSSVLHMATIKRQKYPYNKPNKIEGKRGACTLQSSDVRRNSAKGANQPKRDNVAEEKQWLWKEEKTDLKSQRIRSPPSLQTKHQSSQSLSLTICRFLSFVRLFIPSENAASPKSSPPSGEIRMQLTPKPLLYGIRKRQIWERELMNLYSGSVSGTLDSNNTPTLYPY